jgi:hypothetical protein
VSVTCSCLGQKETPQWLLTAYEKNSATGGSSDIDPEPTSSKQNGTATLQSTASENKETTTNPKNRISEQESHSLNLDDVTIATPEMEAEANPSTTNTMTEQEVSLRMMRRKSSTRRISPSRR